jgi:D-amino-acid dehydrogenase
MAETPQHVVVLGAGIVGVCCAIELRRRGMGVTLVDRGEPGAACSFGNAGILASQSCVPLAMPGVIREIPRMLLDPEGPLVIRWGGLKRTLPWVWRFVRGARMQVIPARADAMKALYGTTHELHEALAREAGVPELIEPSHYFYLYKRPADVDVDTGLAWQLRRERGATIEVFDSPEIRQLEPAVSPAYKRAVRLGPVGRTTNPFRLTQAYAALFQRMGGQLKRAQATRLRPSAAMVTVETDTGPIVGDVVVVAAGSWSLRLLESVGFTFPLIAERGYHVTFADPGIKLNNVCNDPIRHAAISSMEMGLRVAGTEELGDPDAAPAWKRAEVLKRLVREMFPDANLERATSWMGPRPGTPDSLPAIGAVPGHCNIFVAAGHGHLGLTGGPITGRIVSALIVGERLNLDLAPYSAARFSQRLWPERAHQAAAAMLRLPV